MKLKVKIGQIYLVHPKDQNYTSLYEEAFSKHGQTVTLFAVIEINTGFNTAVKKTEYEKVFQSVVNALKKTYITATTLDPDIFEKALNAINSALARLLSKNKADWFGKLNVAIAVLIDGKLSLSTAGNALIYLVRKKDISILSEDLSEQQNRPTKIFVNYSSGRLSNKDRLIISTKQIFNYLSLERFVEFLKEDVLDEACQEIISAVKDEKGAGIASFVVETTSTGKKIAAAALETETGEGSDAEEIYESSENSGFSKYWDWFVRFVKISWSFLKAASLFLLKVIGTILKFIREALAGRNKKTLLIAIGLVAALLAVSIVFATMRRGENEEQNQETSLLSQIEDKLNEAEATLIYNDEARVLAILAEAEELLNQIGLQSENERAENLKNRLNEIKSRISKIRALDDLTILTSFSGIPTDLLRSPNGFLGFNRNSGSIGFYDFRTGQTQTLFSDQNTANLLAGDFVGGNHNFLFLSSDGKFMQIITETEPQIIPSASETPNIPNPGTADINTLFTFGEGASARLYLLDTGQNQVWRVSVDENTVNPAEAWLRTPNVDLNDAQDLAVDGSIFVLFPDRVELYFNGQRQNFALSATTPPLNRAEKIYTEVDYQFVYILDPQNERILIYTKQGELQQQLTNSAFRDLADVYVDEPNRIMYLLVGEQIAQVNF